MASANKHRWKAKYGGLEVSEAQRLRQLEGENRKLKQLVAERALDIVGFKAVLSKSGKPTGQARGRRGIRAAAERSERHAWGSWSVTVSVALPSARDALC
jgi:putative transposase